MEFGLEEYAMATTEMIIRKIKTEADFEDAGKVLKKENLYESFTKVQKALPYYHGKRVLRKNGVLAVLLSFIYSGKIEDTDGWTRDVRAWVKMTFVTRWNALMVIQNGPCDEEEGYVHMLLIPVTNDGKISYDHYFGGCYKLRALQSSYHQLMISRHGLKNTPPGSERIMGNLKTYRFKKQSLSALPEAYQLETGEEYRERIEPLFQETIAYYLERTVIKESMGEPEKAAIMVQGKMQPYLDFIEKYGSVKKAEQMLLTSRELQYGIRAMQEQGNKEMIQMVMNVLKTGKEYMKTHRIE